ncbi:MAG: lipopolysaccharide biosynthesis protein [Bacteroidaceae bacterium]|nr:lipopolysaccharide biosynthesis protein [Bacteroidaceae bacterium]
MASLKLLAKETAIYGMSSIVGRFLNYLLVPLYTVKLSAASGGYGIITNVYAYVALFLVILTYGMETAFFRFANKGDDDPRHVYNTTLTLVSTTSLLFVMLVWLFVHPLASAMGYAEHPQYIGVMATTVAIDAVQCIPFAYLRFQHKAKKFFMLKMAFVVLNITLNLIYFVVINGKDPGYAFYINLWCTAGITFLFYKELIGVRLNFDRPLIRRMLRYAWPILVLGIAGILNQTADKILFPYIYKGGDAHSQLGIYGAASKIAMIMAMITQAFRYAYEPFVFGKAKDADSKEQYAKAMKAFVVFTLLAFLIVVGYMHVLRHIIGSDYWSGLRVVPIVMAAEIMMGVYFNLSFWYKLTDRTIWGAVFSGIGCAVLIAVNVIFVPRYGYMACAWAGVAGYGVAMVLSYVVGQHYYPIRYPLKSIAFYVLLTAAAFVAIVAANKHLATWLALLVNTAVIAAFLALVVGREYPAIAQQIAQRIHRHK